MMVSVMSYMFLWCFILNVGVLFLWFLFFTLLHDWMFEMHSKWFKITEETFDTIHYAGMAVFKIFIIVFNLIPFIALCIAG